MDFVALGLPFDSALRAAAGDAALAHGQLELMLRMTIKSLAGLTIKETLDATQKSKNWELRQEILNIFKSKTKDPSLRMKLKALLGKCSRLSQERNKLRHNAWALSKDGSVVTKGGNHAWGASPNERRPNKFGI